MTLDQFIEQDPDAKITIRRGRHDEYIAHLHGMLWMQSGWWASNVNIASAGYTIDIALQRLDDYLNLEVNQSASTSLALS